MAQESGHGFAGSLRLKMSHEVAVKLSAGVEVSSEGLTQFGRGIHFQVHHFQVHACGCCWASVSHSMSLHICLSHSITSHRAAFREGEKAPEMEATVFGEHTLGTDIPLLLPYSMR